MRKFELIAPCHFGLESVLKREINDLGYDVTGGTDGRVFFAGDEEAIARANIGLRTAERVLIKIGSFKATTYDELFEGTKALNWEDYIPKDARFNVVKAASIKSALFSPSDIQSIMKKAIVERLKLKYAISWFEETGADYPIRVTMLNDVVTVGLDTSGISLQKRGYRKLTSKAPIAENLAAALLKLTPWNESRVLVDPFCGCGTFPIEAALMAANIAPGVNRDFTANDWEGLVAPSVWKDAYDEARDEINMDVETDIKGYDIDKSIIEAARANARLAGVEKLIHFQQQDIKDLHQPKKYGFIVTNPPYGERLEDRAALPALYGTLGERFRALDDWSLFVITSYDGTESAIGRKADKNRKIYNGMMKTYFYSFMGKKPEKRR
ncbi:MAG: class I SAM-dependent RNA methyltransferase [Lachnospiraceae bacterium]|nr:class I SAM-dependent RNA methyltransferase [Lachnospiraceae bacterium]